MGLSIIESGNAVPILVEKEAYSGIRKIANVVAEDISLVCGKKPQVIDEEGLTEATAKNIIICAVQGHSSILARLSKEGKYNADEIAGKWEVYTCFYVDKPFEGIDRALVIAGSDKRGAIYGMFSLSEYAGVSPLVYFGDAAPAKRDNIVIGDDFLVTSREPSVKYRGFFINDEWPCFGNWVCSHFGGFNADAYEQIFIFLLRMKGNYLWPAMWSASFPLDGPDGANEILADELGVVMGYSHHEPCLRASEEWDKVRGENTRYGNAWNYATNKEGLINYWTDALKRSGKYDNLITIGMRGERDTSMLGDDSSIRDNVELLKEIIKKQKELIREYAAPYRKEVPMLLALYKEVEQYYYGDEENEGLVNWEELDDVICMLCEDNFGYTRTLPTEKMRNAGKKFGMYYHLDYHGGPVSYEWVDSTPFSLVWEQMCQVYDFGIKDVWIVNVGDVKFHEVVLSYFMALAYDYDKWGSSNFDSYNEYIDKWCRVNFPLTNDNTRKRIGFVLDEYIKINYLRRPESLNPSVYHPCNYSEADRLLERIDRVVENAQKIMEALCESEKKAFYSMIYYPAVASMNNIRLNVYAGKNHHYASQGRKLANMYKKLAEDCIYRDREFIKEFGEFNDGKWNGMQLASHIGFTKWNEDGCRMPVLNEVYPVSKSRMNVSRKDASAIYDKVYGKPMTIKLDEFMYPGNERVSLEIANDGEGSLNFKITGNDMDIPDWLQVSPLQGEVTDLSEVKLVFLKENIEGRDKAALRITDGDTTVIVEVEADKQAACDVVDEASDNSAESVKAENAGDALDGCIFLEQKNEIIIRADHYYSKEDTTAGWRVIKDYGKYGVGLKAFPVTFKTAEPKEAPKVTYCFEVTDTAEYTIRLFMTPSNPVIKNEELAISYSVNSENTHANQGEEAVKRILIIPSDYRAGDNSEGRWCAGVLSQIRIAEIKTLLHRGRNMLTFYAMDQGVVLQQIGVYRNPEYIKEAYIGCKETSYIRRT